mgnify:CR=1 FL=1
MYQDDIQGKNCDWLPGWVTNWNISNVNIFNIGIIFYKKVYNREEITTIEKKIVQ